MRERGIDRERDIEREKEMLIVSISSSLDYVRYLQMPQVDVFVRKYQIESWEETHAAGHTYMYRYMYMYVYVYIYIYIYIYIKRELEYRIPRLHSPANSRRLPEIFGDFYKNKTGFL